MPLYLLDSENRGTKELQELVLMIDPAQWKPKSMQNIPEGPVPVWFVSQFSRPAEIQAVDWLNTSYSSGSPSHSNLPTSYEQNRERKKFWECLQVFFSSVHLICFCAPFASLFFKYFNEQMLEPKPIAVNESSSLTSVGFGLAPKFDAMVGIANTQEYSITNWCYKHITDSSSL